VSEEQDETAERQLREQEQVSAAVAADIQRAEPVYTHAINALWAGNGAASLAVATTIKSAGLGKPALLPLGLFLAGLICMCLGSLHTLLRMSSAIRRKEQATSILEFLWNDIQSPSESAGLSLGHPRTFWAILAGGFFIVGCIAGFVVLALA
jgi:hypothetical protein